MNKESGVLFLFAIAKEIKRSYECPVILLTQKDYADNIYNSLASMRSAIVQHAPSQAIMEIVNTFHVDWLQAVQDVELLQKRAKETPRESVLKSLDYTMDCIKKRHTYFQQHINRVYKLFSPTEKVLMQDELEVIKDMRDIDGSALLEKQKYLTNSADKVEFTVIILDEIKELLNWLDRLYEYLALQLCELLELPQLPAELSKALQQVIDEMTCFLNPKSQKVNAALNKDKTRPSEPRAICTFKDNSINKIVENIKNLEDRIAQLKNEKSSSSVLALQHKAIFLEDRLESLENLKLSLSVLKNKESVRHKDEEKGTNEEDDIHIFNHLLPHQGRCHLVERLIHIWDTAIADPRTKSSITIMRDDPTQVFRDDLGCFTVDRHGRKLYTKEGDHKIYQLNDMNTLIPKNDDSHHVYFYDECGRYYLTENRVKVYKAHDRASEYVISTTGMLLKLTEMADGVEYQYDSLGRFYIDEDEEKNYCNQGSEIEKYRSDGLGNLVRVRSEQRYFVTCPVEPMATEDSFYLEKTVGKALKRCVAEVFMALPLDPIQYLADRLEKYHFDIESTKTRDLERQELMAERERLKSLERKSPQSDQSMDSLDVPSGKHYNYLIDKL